MGKHNFTTNGSATNQTFAQMVSNLKGTENSKGNGNGSRSAQQARKDFAGKNVCGLNIQESKDKFTNKAKEYASFLKNNYNAEGRVIRAFYDVAECFLENRGVLTLDGLKQKFVHALPHQSNFTEGRKLVSISFTAQKEVRFILDLTEPASPIFLFAGWQDDAQKFLNRFDRSVSVNASKNGCAAMFAPLKDYLAACEAAEKGKS